MITSINEFRNHKINENQENGLAKKISDLIEKNKNNGVAELKSKTKNSIIISLLGNLESQLNANNAVLKKLEKLSKNSDNKKVVERSFKTVEKQSNSVLDSIKEIKNTLITKSVKEGLGDAVAKFKAKVNAIKDRISTFLDKCKEEIKKVKEDLASLKVATNENYDEFDWEDYDNTDLSGPSWDMECKKLIEEFMLSVNKTINVLDFKTKLEALDSLKYLFNQNIEAEKNKVYKNHTNN